VFSKLVLKKLVNVKQLFRNLFKRVDPQEEWNAANDIELKLYAKIFGNDFLHYGYFREIPDDTEKISLHDIKKAMLHYTDLIIERIPTGSKVLDVGCGMGGLLALLRENNFDATGITPNNMQYNHIKAKYPGLPVVKSTFEDFVTDQSTRFDIVITSESFQYIDIEKGIAKIRDILTENGKWILIDYFRINENTKNPSGHILKNFERHLRNSGLVVMEERNITQNVLPNLAYSYMLAKTLAIPLLEHTLNRFFIRRPFLSYLFGDAVGYYKDKIRLDTLDPNIFARDKIYMLYVLKSDRIPT
jgi:cyclopropane fatty-acyl-phospholipid synthase-like methyltransferase